MSKPYIKPAIEEKLVSVQVLRMIAKRGFIEVFWEEFTERRKSDSSISRESVFDDLNRKYFEAFGSFRYSSYDAFRRRINE
jgi:hypothetical protein